MKIIEIFLQEKTNILCQIMRRRRQAVPVEVEDIVPIGNQWLDIKVLTQVLMNNTVALNVSPVGSGKTFIVGRVAKTFNCPVMIFTMKSVKPMWNGFVEKYGLRHVGVPDRKDKTGRKMKYTAHTYNIVARGNYDAFFRDYSGGFEEGFILILDEYQKIKNSTANSTYMLARFIREIVKRGGRSRVCLLSATPIDMRYQVMPLLYALGFVSDMNSSDPAASHHNNTIDMCKLSVKKNRDELRQFMTRMGYRKLRDYIEKLCPNNSYGSESADSYADDINYCYHFERLFVLPQIGVRMPAVKKEGITQTVYNVTAKIHNSSYESTLGEIMRTIEGNEVAKVTVNATQLLESIELAKVPTIVLLALMSLSKKTPQQLEGKVSCTKVPIFVNFLSALRRIAAALAAFCPLIMTGDSTDSERDEMIAKFQRPDCEHRLIIITTATGSTGISLDDQHGWFPREGILSPGNGVINQIQTLGRLDRAATLSCSIFYIVYGESSKDESRATSAEFNMRKRLESKSRTVEEHIVHTMGANDPDALSIIRTLSHAVFKRLVGKQLLDSHLDSRTMMRSVTDRLSEIIRTERSLIL